MWEDAADPTGSWDSQDNHVGAFDEAIFDTAIFDAEPPLWTSSEVPGNAWT